MTDVLERSQAAKAAYRDNPSDETRAEHRAAAQDLRYARWVVRGGPAEYEQASEQQKRRNEALYVRWTEENAED